MGSIPDRLELVEIDILLISFSLFLDCMFTDTFSENSCIIHYNKKYHMIIFKSHLKILRKTCFPSNKNGRG